MKSLVFSLLFVLLLAVPVQAQSDARTCAPGETLIITGTGAPPRTSLLLRWGGRPVGGGVSDAGGGYRLALQVGRERPGDYPVVVEVRETREAVQRLTCTIPGAAPSPTARAITTGPAAGATPRPGATSAATATVATPTPTLPAASFTGSCGDVSDPESAPNYPIVITGLDKSGETVTLQNLSSAPIDITGWTMCSVTGAQDHGLTGVLDPGLPRTFPSEADNEIWNNNTSDPGALWNADGQLVSYWEDK